jgi:hypothetical protein
MVASDILKYGHGWFTRTFDGISEDKLDIPGACGEWSVKDVLAHITSFEVNLIPILQEFVEKGRSDIEPFEDNQQFNSEEVSKRKGKSWQEVLDEYNEAFVKVSDLIKQIPEEKLREVGTLPWYGEEYSLDDYIVYRYYGHKREHGAQIGLWKDR